MRKLKVLRYIIIGGLCLMTHGETQQVRAALAPLQQQIKIPPQLSSVTLNPTSVTGGAQVPGTVTLNQAAPANGVLVKFQNSNLAVAAVPPSVLVQPGATSATFVIQTYPVAQNPNVVTSLPSADISAQIGNFAPKVTKLTVLPPSLTALTVNPPSIRGGANVTGEVAISGPAPAGGLVVTLSTSATKPSATQRVDPSTITKSAVPVTVPQQVTIAPGATSVAFQITSRPVPASTPIQITAAYGVFNTKTATLTILPVGIASLSFPSNIVGSTGNIGLDGGQTATGTVVLTSGAPDGGVDVKLTVSPYTQNSPNPCTPKPSVPATVHVNQGQTSATFPLTTFPAGLNPNWFTISAAYASSAVTMNLHVNQSNVASLALPQSVKGGTTVQLVINLTSPMGQCPSNVGSSLGRITITNNNSVVVQAPSYVQVPGGATSATVTITTAAVAQTTAITFEVYHAWKDYKKVATLTLIP